MRKLLIFFMALLTLAVATPASAKKVDNGVAAV